MRIRSKLNHLEQWDVVEESAHYYVVSHPLSAPAVGVREKIDYEPIPQEWKDVTGEIEIREPMLAVSKAGGIPGGVYHDGVKIGDLCCGGRYRLVRDKLFSRYKDLLTNDIAVSCFAIDAFRIEKRVD